MVNASRVVHGISLLSDHDVYLFREGTHCRLYERLGAHLFNHDGVDGVLFAVWAPNAQAVSAVGDFNDWDPRRHPLAARWDGSGIWEGFVPGVRAGNLYKYRIVSPAVPAGRMKGDPFAFRWECPPRTASIVWDLQHEWHDADWIRQRPARNSPDAPCATYEVHLGSWRRVPEEGDRLLTYDELSLELVRYLRETGFTHVELLPVTEHPFYGSWGYQTLGYFAPTSRHGSPQGFMRLVDRLHQEGIGVLLDWVPSHFTVDEHGLGFFDGTYLYEHSDPRRGFHPDWNSYIFNYGRHEVRSFLISSACFWLDAYHLDGLRVDAVASMLYLDYSRKDGEWIPNQEGGKDNLEAISFLRQLNQSVHAESPSALLVAEESTAWPGVSKPVEEGGLGFDLKWKMGWMHDTLSYFQGDPLHRKHLHDKITFGMWYAYSERFVLPLSHDEVVHGKGSLLSKMPGDDRQKRSNLRLLLGHMYSHPGKKLLFMGAEIGQWKEWDHDHSLDWDLLRQSSHRQLLDWLRDLNRFYRQRPALHSVDFEPGGYEWIDHGDRQRSILSHLRRGGDECLLVVCNFTPQPQPDFTLGIPQQGTSWRIVLNSDASRYGGSGQGSEEVLRATGKPCHNRPDSIAFPLPPLAICFLEQVPEQSRQSDPSHRSHP